MSKQLYAVWKNINHSCYNQQHANFIYCGDNGITVCSEWRDYSKFQQWALSNGYKQGLVLSRKDVYSDFEPRNCEWITDIEHRAKRGKTGKVEYIEWDGREITLAELSKIVGINFNTLRSRYLAGRRGKELVMKPNRGLKVVI